MIRLYSVIHLICSPLPLNAVIYFPVLILIDSSLYSTTPLQPSKITSELPQIFILTFPIFSDNECRFCLFRLCCSFMRSPHKILCRNKYKNHFQHINLAVIIMFATFKLKKFLPFSVAALFLSVLLFFPSACADGITNGIVYSCKILVPSLFPYMVLSSFVMRSGAVEIIKGRLTKIIFALPGCCSAAVLLSFVGGFPVGAK